MAESAVSTVLGSLCNLAVEETKFLCGITIEVAFLKEELMRLRGYLTDADNKRTGNRAVAVLVSQIRDAAYEAQNVIEAVDYLEKRNRLKKGFMGEISRYARLPSDLVTLHKVGGEIHHVRRKLSEIFQSADNLKIDLNNILLTENEVSQEFSQMHQNLEDDVVMVGFEDDHGEILDKLVSYGNTLSAVSIVAMGGAGKTTLAKKVYSSTRVKQHFDIVAWVNVSQTFKGSDLLKAILNQISTKTYDSIGQMQECDVGKEISDILLEKRYLIVLDDVWETDTWDQLNRTVKAFPDAANYSRVLLTTRKLDVANHLQMPTHVHALKNLDEDKSWDLFLSKAFPSYKWSVMRDLGEFEELGRKLARKCDGLPLALTVLGGYLSMNLNTESWSDVLLGWPSTKSVDMMRDILARSYKDLRNHHLRSCFLYLAAFPEDREIDASLLIALWIAEGFIPHAPKHEPEETTRKYLAELAQRSLVQVTERSNAHKWIEKIRIHDILRDWCIEEARKDGFLKVIDETSGEFDTPSLDIMRSYRSSYQGFYGLNFQATANLRALLGFELPSISLCRLRFVRVLHIENSWLRNFSGTIVGCIHLRCLGLIYCKGITLPSSIGKLLYLQTIDMKGTHSVIPKSLWAVPSLTHVSLSNGFYSPKVLHPKELQSLKLHSIKYSDPVRFLGQMTQLRTLRLRTSYGCFPEELMKIFANMPHLVEITLKHSGIIDKWPGSRQFPQSLRSFDLHVKGIVQDPMPVLERLPCLVVLKLHGYNGRTMACSSQGFPGLQNLEISMFHYTEEWNIQAGTMPMLNYLKLDEYGRMGKFPEGLLHLPSLSQLELIISWHLISIGNECTLEELRRKGCEVIIRANSPGDCFVGRPWVDTEE